jgi:hypothetical protein
VGSLGRAGPEREVPRAGGERVGGFAQEDGTFRSGNWAEAGRAGRAVPAGGGKAGAGPTINPPPRGRAGPGAGPGGASGALAPCQFRLLRLAPAFAVRAQ